MENLNKPNIYFPEEILTQILLNLPSKSLLRFRTVCKSWYSIITIPSFISNHLHHKSSSSRSYLVFGQDYNTSTLFVDGEGGELVEHSVLQYPVDVEGALFHGSCNGLLCFSSGRAGYIYVWNPNTRQLLQLPKPLVSSKFYQFGSDYGCNVAFGFHTRANEYKVLRVIVTFGKFDEAEVYSLNSKSWKKLGITSLGDIQSIKPSLVNGVVYWFTILHNSGTNHGGAAKILAFDMGNERFRDIDIPDGAMPRSRTDWNFTSNVGGSLALCSRRDDNNLVLNVWLLKHTFDDQGNNNNSDMWNHRFSIDLGSFRNSIINPVGLRYGIDGDALILECGVNAGLDIIRRRNNRWLVSSQGVLILETAWFWSHQMDSLVSLL